MTSKLNLNSYLLVNLDTKQYMTEPYDRVGWLYEMLDPIVLRDAHEIMCMEREENPADRYEVAKGTTGIFHLPSELRLEILYCSLANSLQDAISLSLTCRSLAKLGKMVIQSFYAEAANWVNRRLILVDPDTKLGWESNGIKDLMSWPKEAFTGEERLKIMEFVRNRTCGQERMHTTMGDFILSGEYEELIPQFSAPVSPFFAGALRGPERLVMESWGHPRLLGGEAEEKVLCNLTTHQYVRAANGAGSDAVSSYPARYALLDVLLMWTVFRHPIRPIESTHTFGVWAGNKFSIALLKSLDASFVDVSERVKT